MATLLIQVLFIAFLATSSAQTCTFCPTRQPLSNGNLVIHTENGTPFTCNDAVEEVTSMQPGMCVSQFEEAYTFLADVLGPSLEEFVLESAWMAQL